MAATQPSVLTFCGANKLQTLAVCNLGDCPRHQVGVLLPLVAARASPIGERSQTKHSLCCRTHTHSLGVNKLGDSMSQGNSSNQPVHA